MPIEKYSPTLDIADMPLPANSPEVSGFPPPPTTSSLPSLIPPAPLVYFRHRAASPIPSSSSVAPSSNSANPDPPASRYLTHSRHPPFDFDWPPTWFDRLRFVPDEVDCSSRGPTGLQFGSTGLDLVRMASDLV
ncbi:hypothetical protein Acr_20g0009900 [Actinidia rufa]|uniref:Uncharacterized protein n=1 Tax=Actinidia rufa TaxID=165716 RepID=A0A7J0GEN0_9ERIC|nr:hypothetical protein Acr_20g0009900 [Actinidia rufa]